jgi:ribonuclease HII
MLSQFDDQFFREGISRLCGVDEAGRGPLAGPVVAAAVVFPRGVRIEGLRDSKELTPKARERLYEEIVAAAVAWKAAFVDHETIDRVNILAASLAAMEEAAGGIKGAFDLALVDGRHGLSSEIPNVALVRADGRSAVVAAASIVAKVTRDRIMCDYHRIYPRYNFMQNKGYGTAEHLRALIRHGPCPIHRRTFSGVRGVEGETQ